MQQVYINDGHLKWKYMDCYCILHFCLSFSFQKSYRDLAYDTLKLKNKLKDFARITLTKK
jgi:hypothetical protein